MTTEPPRTPATPTGRASGFTTKLKHLMIGPPKNLEEAGLFHRLSLIPFLAWVGLGADGLSSSAYGPEEAYRALGDHTFLALGLAIMMAITVLLISSAYSRIIEQFPFGGGGYVVASKLLGARAGLVSGAALLVDYVLTITVSIAAAGDALYSFLPVSWSGTKLGLEALLIVWLTVLNIRGVRESVLTLLPVFLLFIVTHVLVIGYGVLGHIPQLPTTVAAVGTGYSQALSTLGATGMVLLFVHAYSLGGGTYTGIEAVSNGLPIMREPRVPNARRTMAYMAASLAFTASGLLLCYLLWQVGHQPGKTLNAVLLERLTAGVPFGHAFLVLTLVSEGALLVVAAQAGFLDGPRVLGNMAIDSWVPHRFSSLSERLTTHYGIVLMGLASLAALVYTQGSVGHLVVMYSINVFLTFSLSMLGMLRFWSGAQGRPHRKRRLALFGTGLALCATILVITVLEKFREGGWVTLAVTGILIGFCLLIRRHYHAAAQTMERLYAELDQLPLREEAPKPLDPTKPTAAVLVGAYNGLGIHTVLNIFRAFPGFYGNLVFVSVGVIDSGEFKGEQAVRELRERTEQMMHRYMQLASGLGIPATYRLAIGIDPVEEAERLCLEIGRDYPRTTFFAGKMIFQKERWYHRFLHNETALAIQKRLQWAGKTMVTLPVRLREA